MWCFLLGVLHVGLWEHCGFLFGWCCSCGWVVGAAKIMLTSRVEHRCGCERYVDVNFKSTFSGLSADVRFFAIGPSIYTRGGYGVDLPLSLLQ